MQAEGYPLNCYVGDELYVAEHTAASEAYASFQHLEVHAVGDLLAWLSEPPTKLVAVGDPVELDGARSSGCSSSFDGRMYISKSLPYFLEFASPEVTKASGLAFVAEQLGFSQERDGRVRRRRERRRARSSGPATRSRSRTRTSACSPSPTSSARPCSEEGVAQVIEAYLAR